jgi:hypothetical protein
VRYGESRPDELVDAPTQARFQRLFSLIQKRMETSMAAVA